MRNDEARTWKTTKIFYGGKRRKIRYKEVQGVYWQRGAGQQVLRLIVVAPHSLSQEQEQTLVLSRPGLCADQRPAELRQAAVADLLRSLADRSESSRGEDTLGIGQAQLWNVTSVPKQPVLAVAAYSALLLASHLAFGADRGKHYAQLPKWRRNARRPSCLDLITLLRKEMAQQPQQLASLRLNPTDSNLVRAAAA